MLICGIDNATALSPNSANIIGYTCNMTKTSHDSETAAHGQQVITACAFIHYNFDGTQKVFLPKRADTKKFLPGVYELPGGHIDFGEDITTGLAREIKEEFDMNINVGDPFAAFTYSNHIKGSHSVEVIFFAQFTESIEDIKTNPEDHSTYGWFAENELDKVLSDGKNEDDVEIQAIKKGFTLLKGQSPNF